jgi:hypothetical protein
MQITDHTISTKTSNTEISDLLTDLSTKVKNSTTGVTTHLFERLDQTDANSNRNTENVAIGLGTMERNHAIQHDQFRDSIKTLEQSLVTGFKD